MGQTLLFVHDSWFNTQANVSALPKAQPHWTGMFFGSTLIFWKKLITEAENSIITFLLYDKYETKLMQEKQNVIFIDLARFLLDNASCPWLVMYDLCLDHLIARSTPTKPQVSNPVIKNLDFTAATLNAFCVLRNTDYNKAFVQTTRWKKFRAATWKFV